jgi:hypothetical protein
MLALAADGAGLLGLTRDAKGAIETWRSTDASTWTNSAATGIDGTPSTLVVTTTGYLAVGRNRSGCGLIAWTSPDANTWTAAESLPGTSSPCPTGGDPRVDEVVAGSHGVLALGRLANGRQALWTSPDGRTWQRQDGPRSGHIAAVATGGTGYVAVGDDGGRPASAAAWTLRDGGSWIVAPVQPSFVGATMANVVALADGRLVSIGSEPGPAFGRRFVAWTSADGVTWRRSPEPLCQAECDADVPGLLATDGRRLVVAGASNDVLLSPRVTAGLRPATLVLGFDHPPAGTWTSGPVAGSCAPADDPTAAVGLGAAYPRLANVGPAWGSASYTPSVQLVLGPDGSVQNLGYDRGDDAGFTGSARDAGPGAFLVGPDRVSLDAGSTALQGRLEFRGLPVSRSDPSLPAVPPVSGWLSWSCGW